jgi:hypothetical protein
VTNDYQSQLSPIPLYKVSSKVHMVAHIGQVAKVLVVKQTVYVETPNSLIQPYRLIQDRRVGGIL